MVTVEDYIVSSGLGLESKYQLIDQLKVKLETFYPLLSVQPIKQVLSFTTKKFNSFVFETGLYPNIQAFYFNVPDKTKTIGYGLFSGLVSFDPLGSDNSSTDNLLVVNGKVSVDNYEYLPRTNFIAKRLLRQKKVPVYGPPGLFVASLVNYKNQGDQFARHQNNTRLFKASEEIISENGLDHRILSFDFGSLVSTSASGETLIRYAF